MSALAAAAAGALVAALYWTIAAGAAKRRRLALGALPAALLAVVACGSAAAWFGGAHVAAIGALAGVAVAGWTDARTGSIFDPLTALLGAASLLLGAADGTVRDGICGGAAAGCALLVLHAVTRGRGLGLGDVKLAAALGTALGLAGGLHAIAFAFIFGGAYGAWLLLTKRACATTAVRFGPFLAAGTYVAVIVPLAVVR